MEETMYQRILVPLDGSAAAAQVLPLARALAAGMHSTLVLFRALEPVHGVLSGDGAELKVDEQMAILSQRASDALEPVRDELDAAGIPFKLVVRFGSPADAILDYAERGQIDLITMATHGRTGLARIVHGSVTGAVLSNGRVPLIVVRASETPIASLPRISRILVPLDGTALAASALPHAQELAAAFDADLLLFSIWDTFGYPLPMSARDAVEAEILEKHAVAKRYFITQAAELEARGVRARWQLETGLIVESIVAAAERQAVSLIVMSTHGRRGFNLWMEGSVADEVLRSANIPILLVREPVAESVSSPLAA
jgi:nucleotide-binding universal stress UspA family protein